MYCTLIDLIHLTDYSLHLRVVQCVWNESVGDMSRIQCSSLRVCRKFGFGVYTKLCTKKCITMMELEYTYFAM